MMADSERPILPLPREVTEKVQSSVLITNLNEVVVELVKNSLDAGAESVHIIIDYKRGGCVVEDDGYGLPSAEFEDGSGLAQAHNTSKAGRESVFSCKGLFLAALATMSLLTISSLHRGQSKTNTIMFHDSRVISRLIPAPTHQEIQGNQGTRVTVNNLFGNMPVRIKHRASTLRRSEDIDREWDGLKRMLVALALSNTQLRKIRLSDKDRTRTLNLRVPAMTPGALQSRTTDFDILRVQTILSQSNLITSTNACEWVSMSASTLDLSAKAYVALSSSPTRLNQFISFGINPIFNGHNNANILYDEINQIFAASDFGLNETYEDGIKLEARGSRHRGIIRGSKRWPMFYLCIDIKRSWEVIPKDGVTVESDRTLRHIIDIVHAMFYQFLQQHHFRPQKRQRSTRGAPLTSHHVDAIAASSNDTDRQFERVVRTPSISNIAATSSAEAFDCNVRIPPSSKKQSSHYFNNFTNWSRVKSGDNKAIKDLLTFQPLNNENSRTTTPTSKHNYERILETNNQTPEVKHQLADELVPWVDPSTNRTILVNSRTGQRSAQSCGGDRPGTATGITRPRSTGSLMSRHTKEPIRRPHTAPAHSQSVWFEKFVDNWANPVLSYLEQPVMSTETASVFDYPFENKLVPESKNRSWDPTEEFNAHVNSSKLSRKALAAAAVIAQVDRKFILVRVRTAEDDNILVLVDQHAADERCRLESLLSDMFATKSAGISIRVHQLQTPIKYPIQKDEIILFKAYSAYFESWGCHYEIQQEPIDTERRCIVLIKALPLAIVERCRLEPKLFVDLLRKEIWSRAGESVPPLRTTTTTTLTAAKLKNDSFPWLRWIAGCPEGIIDLINSRACRSAIMFNDPLSIDDCQRLVSRLSSCAFPFQCAHGRPTMIPIVDGGRFLSRLDSDLFKNENGFLQKRDQEGKEKEKKKESFVDAFKNWKRS